MINAPYWIAGTHQDAPVPTSLALRGELRLSRLEEDSCRFLELLGSQITCYKKVTLKNCGFLDFRPLQRLISGIGENLRQLDIVAEGDRKHAAFS